MTGSKQDSRNLNAYLDRLQLNVFEAHRALIDAGKAITAENIKKKITGVL